MDLYLVIVELWSALTCALLGLSCPTLPLGVTWDKQSGVFEWEKGRVRLPPGLSHRDFSCDTFEGRFTSPGHRLVIWHDIGYYAGAWVRRLGPNGGLWISNKRWEVSRALAGQHVELEKVGQRILVRYCRTTVREFDLNTGLSLPVDIRLREFVWPTDNEEAGAGAPGQSRNGAGEAGTPPSL